VAKKPVCDNCNEVIEDEPFSSWEPVIVRDVQIPLSIEILMGDFCNHCLAAALNEAARQLIEDTR
jgi:hypothetical protein